MDQQVQILKLRLRGCSQIGNEFLNVLTLGQLNSLNKLRQYITFQLPQRIYVLTV